jgi:choline dehydrogenase-like flavoprotein
MKPIFEEQGRSTCQSRTICERGCPFGAYFSANSTLIPWAKKTGNLTLQSDSVVHSIIYDEEKCKAIGVKVIHAETMEETEYFAEVIFVNAATLNTNLILLNSKSKRFPNGLGNDNGLLGKYVGFHNYKAYVNGFYDGSNGFKTDGRRPTSTYIPRFRNLRQQDEDADFLRGYAVSFYTSQEKNTNVDGYGKTLSNNLLQQEKLGAWRVGVGIMGETIPKETNYVTLDEKKKDKWGIPQLKISIDYDENDHKMTEDFLKQFTEMFEKAGFTAISTNDTDRIPGLDIHEMGGVRMGKNPKTSLVNEWNQLHLCKNVFVTDGACMTSFATQNPSLTFMAMTARAANYAVEQLKKGRLD